ncbi:BREX protein BrxB domain-containing protein [Vulgatibacter incomptus]|uniref:DUF1788 domain-containing protein n=1 Tax=Vulgatibacter incomptus TaxID=1391653 RepID=A0A0K1PBY7_9BACT|nr:BREX protein BrxB domain-containing protein [Vulgatibacter incomptus]AKU90921.1 hypothetical protein AKJ08_1308 [Vulgatibacter incomptus]
MTQSSMIFQASPLRAAFQALRRDLLADGGPQISTMQNYRFAIVPYQPDQEFALRREVKVLSDDLMAAGWVVLSIPMHQIMLEKIRVQGTDFVQHLIAREKRLSARGEAERALQSLRDALYPLLEGPDGIAADVARRIASFCDAHPDQADRTVALIGRIGALYPFFRSSALLKHLDGNTRGVPVVLLYPGERGDGGLSFMGELPPDRDYRPRIYP